jgi:hypothetical protein
MTKYSTKKNKRGGLSIRANNDMLSHEICDKKNITSYFEKYAGTYYGSIKRAFYFHIL